MITKSVTLACAPDRAFALFTEEASAWWPAARRHSDDPMSAIVLEPTGRFYERASDGREVDMGVVRAFEPPHRLLLDWYPGTGPANPTRVEVTFTPVAEGTLVTVRHDRGTADHSAYTDKAPAYDRSWDLVLAAYRAAV